MKPTAFFSWPALANRTGAAERAWLARLGLAAPARVPGPLSGHRWVAPTPWLVRGAGRRRIDAAALRTDLRWLQRILREGYAGWAVAERRGWSWRAFFRRWDRHLQRRSPRTVSIGEAFAPWRDFLDFLSDGHSGPLARLHFPRGSQTLLVAAPPGGAVAAVQLADGTGRSLEFLGGARRLQPVKIWRLGRLEPAAMLALPASWGLVQRIRVARRWRDAIPVPAAEPKRRGRTIAALAGAPSDRPAFRRRPKAKVDYLRIPTLTPENARRLHRLAERLNSTRRAGAALVVDLRQNSGGDHSAAVAVLRSCLPAVAWSDFAEIPLRRMDSPVVAMLRWGFLQARLAGTRGPLAPVPRRGAQRLLDELASVAAGLRCHREILRLPAPAAAGRRGPRLVLILVDEGCASDGELLVWLLRRLPGALVAGTCTHGAAQFIQPGDALLPNSRVAFRVATAETDLHGDGRPVDGHGLPVDIVLPDEAAHSPGSIMALIRALLAQRIR